MAWEGSYYVPDVSRPLSQFAEGIDTMAADRRNREIGELAASGRLSDAATISMRGGDLKTGLALRGAAQDENDKIVSTLGKYAQAADTPEKWGKFIGAAKQRFPGANLDQFADFSARDAVLAEVTDPDQKWKRELETRKEIREQEAHDLKMSTEGSKAPQVETFFDEQGREIKRAWNPATRRFEKVGGAKAEEPKIQEFYDEATGQPYKGYLGSDGRPVRVGGTKADSPKLEELYDEKTGQPYKAIRQPDGTYQRVGGVKAPSGTKLSVGPDGQVTFEQGSNAGLNQATTTEIQKKAVNAAEVGSRMSSILENFDPKDQTLGTRFHAMRLSGQAKLNPDSLSPGDRKQLEGFAKRKSTAIANLNRTLNELSGAAVSPQESERLQAEIPNPGTGLFDGDDPVTFEAKAKGAVESINKALARYAFYQKTGIPKSLDEIPLNNVRQVNGEWYVIKDGKAFKVGSTTPAEIK